MALALQPVLDWKQVPPWCWIAVGDRQSNEVFVDGAARGLYRSNSLVDCSFLHE